MTHEKLEVVEEAHVEEAHDEKSWIQRLSGDLYGNAEGYEFQERMRRRFAPGAQRVVIDMSKVRRIDSSGIGILVAIMWSASNAGGGLVLAALPPKIERILGLAMLLEHVGHAPDVEQGLERLAAMDLPSGPA